MLDFLYVVPCGGGGGGDGGGGGGGGDGGGGGGCNNEPALVHMIAWCPTSD